MTGSNSTYIDFSGGHNSVVTFHNVNFNSVRYVNFYGNSKFTGTVSFGADASIRGNNEFTDIVFAPGHTYTLERGSTQIVNNSITSNGNCAAPISIRSSASILPANLQKTSGSVTLNYIQLEAVNAIGGADFFINNAINLGNNNGWTINSTVPSKNLYWIKNSGLWDDPNHWSLASGGLASGCIPSANDNVFFDANSFTKPNQIVTTKDSSISYCRNVSWVGATNNPTFKMLFPNRLKVFGSFELIRQMNVADMSYLEFESKNLGNIINPAGHKFQIVFFKGVGGSWTLQDSLTSEYIHPEAGTINTNGQKVNVAGFYKFDSLPAILNMTNSVFDVSLGWNTLGDYLIHNFQINGGTSTVNMIESASILGARDASFHNVNFNNSFGGGVFADCNFTGDVNFYGAGSFYGSNTLNNVKFSPGYNYSFGSSTTQTITGNFIADGKCDSLISIQASSNAIRAMISKPTGTISFSYVSLKDIATSGGASFLAMNAIDYGNNLGWTINSLPSRNLYWVGDSGNWNDASHWALTSGGVGIGSCPPTSIDNVFFDANSFTLPNQKVLVNSNAFAKDVTWNGVTNLPKISVEENQYLRISGSLTLEQNMETDFLGLISFEAQSAGNTITTSGKNFSTVLFNGVGGEWTLQDSLTVLLGSTETSGTGPAIFVRNGTLNSNDQVVSANFIEVAGEQTTLNMDSSIFNINWVWFTGYTVNNTLINASNSTINMKGDQGVARIISYGNFTLNNLNFTSPQVKAKFEVLNNVVNTFTGSVVFSGDGETLHEGYGSGQIQFKNIKFSPDKTLLLSDNISHIIQGNLDAIGFPNNLITIKSTTSGIPATIIKPTGSICLDYVRLKDINATGGAFFNAGLSPTRSLDMGGNTGWVFTGNNTTFYQDADGDGFGNPAITAPTQSCTRPEGFVANNTDCNDTNAEVYPGAIELCNGIDDNCNGQIDDALCGQICLGNRVWYDANGNGKDDNEPALYNSVVELYKMPNSGNNTNPFTAGTFISSTTTNDQGYYTFCNVPVGKYIVVVTTPGGFVRSVVNNGDPDNNKDGDNNGIYSNDTYTWGKAITLTINGEPNGNTNNTYDFGFKYIENGNNKLLVDNSQNKTESVLANETKLNIAYPNPFKDKINFVLQHNGQNEKIHISIFSTTGKIVVEKDKEITKGQNNISISELAKLNIGFYILQIRLKSKVLTHKINKL